MNRRDRELLDRQLKRLQPLPPRNGIIMLTIVGVYIAGMSVGSFLFAFGSQAGVQNASNDGTTALAFLLNGIPVGSR